jgi:hypothetical protein
MAGEMFDIVPFLRGRYLYYSEYMIGTAFFIVFCGFILFKFLSFLVRPSSPTKVKVEEETTYFLQK